jgi:chemotaxis protein MotB
MASSTAAEETERYQRDRPRPSRRSGAGPILFLIAVLVAGGGFLLFYFLEHEPTRASLASTSRELREARSQNRSSSRRVITLERERDRLQERIGRLRASEEALRRERDQLARERDALRSGHEQAQAALAALQEAQDALRQRLQAELASGEAQLRDDGDVVTVELDERILFPSGHAELNPRGREVLERVAQSLAALPNRTIRVEGHTDSTPISADNESGFPTNWELSTSRATSVVRFFEAQGIAGSRLSAVGWGQHHPVATNDTVAGRRRNRRIEIVLVRSSR